MRLATEEAFDAAADRFSAAMAEVSDIASKAQCALRRSQALWQAGRLSEADSQLLSAQDMATDPAVPAVLLNIGHEWVSRGHSEQASKALTVVADGNTRWYDSSPYNGMTLDQALAEYALAELDISDGALVDAEDHLARCIASQYEEVAPYALVACATELRSRLSSIKREELLTRAVDYDHPDASPRAALELGLLYEELLAVSSAEKMFERAASSMHPEVMVEANQRLKAAPDDSARGDFTSSEEPAPAGHRRVIVCGAGTGAQDYTSSVKQLKLPLHIVGYLDDDVQRLKRHRAPVLGRISDLPRLIGKCSIDDVVFAIPSAPGAVRAQVLETCRQADVPMHDLPSMYTLNVNVPVAQQIDHPVSLDALVGTKPRVVDREAGLWLRNMSVLITGAGSALGAELCRRAVTARAAQVFAVDASAQQRATLRQDLARSGFDRVRVVARPPLEEHMDAMFCVLEPGASDTPEEASEVVRQAVADAFERVLCGTQVMLVSAYVPSEDVALFQRSAEQDILASVGTPTPAGRLAAMRIGETLRGVHGPLTQMEDDGRTGVPIVVRGPRRRRLLTVERAVELVLRAAHFAEHGHKLMTCGGEEESLDKIASLVADQHERLGRDRLPVIYQTQDRPELLQEGEVMRASTQHPQVAFVRGFESVRGDKLRAPVSRRRTARGGRTSSEVLVVNGAGIQVLYAEDDATTLMSYEEYSTSRRGHRRGDDQVIVMSQYEFAKLALGHPQTVVVRSKKKGHTHAVGDQLAFFDETGKVRIEAPAGKIYHIDR